jgi:Domain of unknown function (DUF4287)/Domain of unknown function (DUF5655)
MNVPAALQTQIRNIEEAYGEPLDHWFAVIDASTLTNHHQMVAMLKEDHGLAHGAAHRVALLARDRGSPTEAHDPADALYTGPKAAVRPLHDAVMGAVRDLGTVDVVPKKGYLSLRCSKQFAMLQPSTTGRLDLGLVLPGITARVRLEPPGSFNRLFTHRVRLTAVTDIDDELRGWLAIAYAKAAP